MPDTLKTGFNIATPLTTCRLPRGDVLFANGLDKVQRWDGFSASLENAGVPKPATQPTVTYATNSTYATSKSYYGVQFLDDESIPGNMSTLSSFVAYSFTTLTYRAVPISSESRVTKRRIWRSTTGQSVTLYLDKEISDNTTTIVTSTKTDSSLIFQTEQRILNPDGSLAARRFGIPPSDKEVVVFHQDRTFYVVDAKYREGHLVLTQNIKTFTAVGAKLTSQMVGRKVHVKGSTRLYTFSTFISTVSARLNPAWASATNKFGEYSIELPVARKNIVDVSEPNEPEAVPTANGIIPQSDGAVLDRQTGAMQLGSFLHILCERHIYRWTFLSDPKIDGAIFNSANRGCINQRCWCRAENVAYLMDRQGIYRFDGGSVDPLSFQIQDFFRIDSVNADDTRINWDRAKWFHCSYYPGEDVVRFFVCLDTSNYPKHAICIHHRTRQIWVEEYPWKVASSVVVPISGRHRLLLGSELETLYLTGVGTLDGPSSTITARQAVTATSAGTVTVATTQWTDAELTGAEVAVCAGQGKGQRRRIISAVSATGVVTVDRDWTTTLHTATDTNPSTIQLCGVYWRYKTGIMRFEPDSSSVYRRYQVVFDPTTSAGSIDFRKYSNRSATADTNYSQVDVSPNTTGVNATTDYEINTKLALTYGDNDGAAWIRDDGNVDDRGPSDRFVAVEMSGFQNENPVVIHSIRYDGVK